MFLPQLRRVRWAVRATLVLGVAASVVANVLHALDNPISQAIAAWPPLALLLTVELISRVPVHRRSLAAARLVATATIAGIAAWVSYWHMVGVAARYGESGASPYLLPLSVDGLIVVASICLVELGGRISSIEGKAATASAARPTAESTAAPAAQAAVPALADSLVSAGSPVPAEAAAQGATAQKPAVSTGTRATRSGTFTAPVVGSRGSVAAKAPARTRRSSAQTVELAQAIRAARPDVADAEVAAELGISTSRLRSVLREAAQTQVPQTKATQPAAARTRTAQPAAAAAARPAAARNGATKTAAARAEAPQTAAARTQAAHPAGPTEAAPTTIVSPTAEDLRLAA